MKKQGTAAMQGATTGIDFLPQSAASCYIAKLLRCYEQPLQPFIEQAISNAYRTILNLSFAEGYYAVGMARRMPSILVLAFDLNSNAQEVCTILAQKNSVANRVKVGALFKPEDFANYANQKVLVLCDIEGAEKDLLNSVKSPALKCMDLIVESHECLVSGITQTPINRFKESYEITLVQDNGQRKLKYATQWFNNLAHLDQLLATWEWRSGDTPWLAMKAR